jgi:hypothetical protein
MIEKKIVHLFRICLILFSIIGCRAASQENNSDEKIKKVLNDFYVNYITASSKLNYQKSDSIIMVFCTSKLVNYINQQIKEGNLDYDPFINSQMIDLSMLQNIKVQKDSVEKNIYFVSYFRPYYKKFITIKLGVIQKENRVLIDSIFIEYNHENNPN